MADRERERVWYAGGRTINSGSLNPKFKFESHRLDLGRETFVEPDETPEEAYTRVKNWVESVLDEEDQAIRNLIRNRR